MEMAKMRKITTLLILLAIALISVPSCAPTVSQQEYDRVSNELSAIQSQLASLQDKLVEYEAMKAKYEDLSEQYDTLESEYKALQAKYDGLSKLNDIVNSVEDETIQAKYDELSKQYDTLKSEYKALQAKHDELSKQYAAVTEGTTEINEEDVEQAIFELINQERKNNGLDELIWGVNLYKKAKNHSRNMATNQRLEDPEQGSYQEVIWATGYTKTQRMAEAIFTIWENTYRYELEFLNSTTTYGAVAVYKSGEIFYITYISDIFR